MPEADITSKKKDRLVAVSPKFNFCLITQQAQRLSSSCANRADREHRCPWRTMGERQAAEWPRYQVVPQCYLSQGPHDSLPAGTALSQRNLYQVRNRTGRRNRTSAKSYQDSKCCLVHH